MGNFWKDRFADIRGNLIWQILVWVFGGGMITAVATFIQFARHHELTWNMAILVFVISTLGLAVAFLLASQRTKSDPLREATQSVASGQLSQIAQGTPGLLPGEQPVDFDAMQFFKTAYQSGWTADVEKRIKVAANQNSKIYAPEDFYAKLIGIGLISYKHDITWAYIWKSQLLMLAELAKRGFLTISQTRKFYDQGVRDYPMNYVNYSFQQWLSFVETEGFFLRRPADVLEITMAGRDFLGYLAFRGWQFDQRKG